MLYQLAQCSKDGPRTATRLASVLLDLLATGLARRVTRSPVVAVDAQRRALTTSVQAFIERHLDDPALSPAMIAAAHHISPRYLHKLFETEQTTVMARIRERRLERARRDLFAPVAPARSVAAIAATWGFGSAEGFSRVFRDRYGAPPGEYRRGYLGS